MTILANAADVLRCFTADRDHLTVTEVATRLSMPKSTISRLLRAMRDAGFLESARDSKQYRPGLLAFELGQLYRARSSLIARADAVVARLVAETGHTGYVSCRDGGDALGLTYHPGHNALRVARPAGRRLEAYASSTGRALLARLPDPEVRRLFPGPLTRVSDTAPRSMEDLLARLARIRIDGFAEANDEANRGVGALAAAVGDAETGEEVSLCIAFPLMTITDAERAGIVDGLLAGAREIAAIFGDARCAALAAART
jgi:DNA-binding IclR family transcriptional regulator